MRQSYEIDSYLTLYGRIRGHFFSYADSFLFYKIDQGNLHSTILSSMEVCEHNKRSHRPHEEGMLQLLVYLQLRKSYKVKYK